MKKFITFLSLVAAMFMLTPTNAEARDRHHHHHRSHTYCSGHASCGCAIYTKRVFRYYDRHGHPVYKYYRQPISHRCSRYHRGHYRYNDCDDYRYSRYRDRRYGHARVSYRTPYGSVTIRR